LKKSPLLIQAITKGIGRRQEISAPLARVKDASGNARMTVKIMMLAERVIDALNALVASEMNAAHPEPL
jgi:hypothetical protein